MQNGMLYKINNVVPNNNDANHHQNAESKEYRTSPTVAAVKRMEQEVSEACKESYKVKELLKESAVMLNLA